MKQVHNKLKSAKLWIAVWACLLITFIVAFDRTDFMQLALVLTAIPIAYAPINVWQKHELNKDTTA